MSRVLSIRLKDPQAERLERIAARLGRTRSEAAAVLLEEALRREEFGFIEFRSTTRGREAFLHGTRIKAWQIVWLAEAMGRNPGRIAEHLGIAEELVRAGFAYADAFPEETQTALAAQNIGVEELRRMLPALQVITVDTPAS